jgi:hypothetical protein
MKKEKRMVLAPQAVLVSSSQLPTSPVISVELCNDEDVEWAWTLLPNGESYVSGYNIIKKLSSGE